jgi:hypothetical protein
MRIAADLENQAPLWFLPLPMGVLIADQDGYYSVYSYLEIENNWWLRQRINPPPPPEKEEILEFAQGVH